MLTRHTSRQVTAALNCHHTCAGRHQRSGHGLLPPSARTAPLGDPTDPGHGAGRAAPDGNSAQAGHTAEPHRSAPRAAWQPCPAHLNRLKAQVNVESWRAPNTVPCPSHRGDAHLLPQRGHRAPSSRLGLRPAFQPMEGGCHSRKWECGLGMLRLLPAPTSPFTQPPRDCENPLL